MKYRIKITIDGHGTKWYRPQYKKYWSIFWSNIGFEEFLVLDHAKNALEQVKFRHTQNDRTLFGYSYDD